MFWLGSRRTPAPEVLKKSSNNPFNLPNPGPSNGPRSIFGQGCVSSAGGLVQSSAVQGEWTADSHSTWRQDDGSRGFSSTCAARSATGGGVWVKVSELTGFQAAFSGGQQHPVQLDARSRRSFRDRSMAAAAPAATPSRRINIPPTWQAGYKACRRTKWCGWR
jgi:hypothetical protein